MAKARWCFFGLLGVLLSTPAPARSQEWTPEQQRVWSAVEELWELSGQLDFEPWFDRVGEEYRGWAITSETPRGKAEWRQEAQGRLERPRRIHHQIVPKAIDIHGDVAIVYYLYASLTRSEEGAYSLSKGQWTDVFRRQGGRWLLIADAGGETEAHPDILVSAAWLDRRRGEPKLVILQVESREGAYDEGHIPGALPLPYDRIAWEGHNDEGAELRPLEEIEATLESLGISNDDQIVVYSSHPLVATRLWFTLDLMGVGQPLSLLDGGLSAWKADGLPLSTESPAPPPPGNLTLDPSAQRLVDAQWVQDNLAREDVALVDARYRKEYTGEEQEGDQVGHIPGAGNAVWEEMIESRELFRFQPVETLAAKLAAAGVDPGETVVPYCIVGLRGSLDYFVARMLGYEARLYDGSWKDWIQRGLPLVAGEGRQPPPQLR